MMRNRTSLAGAAATLAAIALCATSVAVAAPADDNDIRVAGTCTGSSSAKLKLSEEDGGIEVEYEVDQNRAGQRWAIVLRQNGAVVRRATRVTRGPSGSFEARFVAGNGAGSDRFSATATRPGEVCTARASF